MAGKVKKARSKEVINSYAAGFLYITTKKLHSANHWHGRPRYVYLGERRAWEKVLAGAPWQPMAKGHLTIKRYVASSGHLIKDRDNLVAACKPVRDVIVRLGLLPDDNDEIMTFDIHQEIDREFARVELLLEER